jgi:hypothetical protein
MSELYKAANSPPNFEPEWIKVQRAVFSGSENADEDLEQMIQLRTGETVPPILRKAIKTDEYKFKFGSDMSGTEVQIKRGEMVILGLVSSSKTTVNLR